MTRRRKGTRVRRRARPGTLRAAAKGLFTTGLLAPGLLLGAAAGAVLTGLALRLPGLLGPASLVVLPWALLAVAVGLRDQRGGIALFAAGLPAGLTSLFGGVQVVQVLAAGAIALVVGGRVLRGQTPLVLPPAVLALLVVVGWSLLMTPVAPDLPRAMRWNAGLLTATLLVAAVATATNAALHRLRQLTLLLFAGSVATCAFALPESTQRRAFGAAVVEGRAQGVFNQPNELGLFAGTTAVLALALLVSVGASRHPRAERVALGVGGSIALVALALSLSRGAWLGTLLALVVGVALAPAVRRVVLLVLGSAALVLLALIGAQSAPSQLDVIGGRVGLIADRGANPYDERPAIWGEGLRQVREHPWTGVGAAGFTDGSRRSPSSVAASARPAHAHNVVLNFAAEGGLPAGFALVTAIVLTGVGVRRGYSRPGWSHSERAFLITVGCAPLVLLGQGLLDAPIRNPTTLLHSAAVLGLAAAVGHVRPHPGPGRPGPRQSSRQASAASVSAAGVLSSVSGGASSGSADDPWAPTALSPIPPFLDQGSRSSCQGGTRRGANS